MVRKKQQLDRAKKRSRWKTGEDESAWDATIRQALDALQALVFQSGPDRSKMALLKELHKRAPLLAAAYCGHKESVDALINSGTDVNITARDGSTPVMLAISQGHTEIAQMLLEGDADPTVVNQEGLSAIQLSVRHMDTAMFNDLWNKLETLGRAAHNSMSDKNNKSLLHAAAEIGWDYGVTFLLGQSSTDIEHKSRDGKTALMWAAAEGQANTVGRLVQAGARTLIEDASGATAACLAICRRHDETANELFRRMSSSEKERYVSRRVSLLSAPTSSARDHRNRDALFRVLLFIRRRVQRGTELLLTNGVFVALASCGRRNLTDALVLGPLFHLCACLLHDKADYSKYVHRDMVEAFIQSDALELAREVLGDGTGDFQRRCTALLPVLPVAEVEEGLQWVREHLSELEGPCREFAAKKDMLVYWTEGEDVKTAVMWERYKENFTRLYLEARGTPLDFGGHARDEQSKEACRPFAHHALLQSTGCRPKSPVPASKKTNQKALSKKSARPRAVPAMLQVTFREDTRVVEEKPPKVQPCPPRPEVKQPATEPMTVFRAMMSKAPAAITKVLPLVGYANAVKSNLPKEEPPLEQVATQEDTKQTRFKFTADGLRNVDKKLDYSFLLSPIISPDDGSCSSQPLSLEAYAESICLRRVHSDPSLESLKTKTAIKNKLQGLEHSPSGDSALNGENRAHPAPGIIGPSTVAKGTGDNSALTCGKAHMKFALTSTVVHYGNMPAELASVSQPQRLEQSVTVSDKCERILACRRTHCLQEHMLKEILQSRELKTAKDQDTASATLILAQTLFRAMNCLQLKTADKTKGTRDARIENRPLCAVDEDCGDASTKQGKSGTETVWLGSFASVAAKEAGQEEKPTLSAVWLSENMRWKNAFCEIANVPLSTLTDVHGFFYNQEKKRILPPARYSENISVHLGIAKNGREVIMKKIQFSPTAYEMLLERIRNFRRLDMTHANIVECHVTCKTSLSSVYVIWHPQDRNLEQYMSMIREHKLPLVKWGRMAMGQLLDVLAFLHTRNHPVLHGRLKPSNILVTPKGSLLVTDLVPHGVLPPIPIGFIKVATGSTKGLITDASWRPREFIRAINADLATRLFSTGSDIQVAGMLICYMLTGLHPFGKCDDDCQTNILSGRVKFKPVNAELDDLVHHMLTLEPEYRLPASRAVRHPVFWGARKRLFFLATVAHELENLHKQWPNDVILAQFESACGIFSDWPQRVPAEVVQDVFPEGSPTNVAVSLLAVIKRCTLQHDTMSPEAQAAMKQPERFFLETFPGLLMAVHGVVRRTHWRYIASIDAFF